MQNPRKIAMNALLSVNQNGGYSNIVIDSVLENSDMDSRDKAFASAIFYGVLERQITLDFIISKYSKTPMKKLSPTVLEALRIGLYQIFYMDKVPESAAVDQSVKLVKKSKDNRFSGFVNGILRSILRDGKEKCLECSGDSTKKMSVEYSVPVWLCNHFKDSYGAEIAEGFLYSAFNRPPITIKVNNIKISPNELKKLFSEKNIVSQSVDLCDDVLELSGAGAIEKLPEYGKGYFHVQDIASVLCCKTLSPNPGDRVLDLCAAPGGKSFTLAEMIQNKGEILSLDLYEHKIKLINDGAKRLGLDCISAKINDASIYNEKLGVFDKVLCDLPCSGLGIIRRKPEIRYKNDTILDIFPKIQYGILNNCVNYLKDGGILVYSTCTLNPLENGKICERFLKEHTDFEPMPVFTEIPRAIDEPNNNLTLFTHIHQTDGFFISAFRKVK